MSKRKPGRPKSANAKRKHIHVRCDDLLYVKMQIAASEVNLPVSAWLRGLGRDAVEGGR